MLEVQEKHWGRPTHNPLALLSNLHADLEQRGFVCILQTHSVRIMNESHFIDVVPALRRDGVIMIPEIPKQPAYGRRGRWLNTDPEKHNKFAETRGRTTNGFVLDRVRMLKFWRHERFVDNPLRSIHIELMTMNDVGTRPGGYLRGVRQGFTAMMRGLKSGCLDPSTGGRFDDSYLSSFEKSKVDSDCHSAVFWLERAEQADSEGDHDRAIDLIRFGVFGPTF